MSISGLGDEAKKLAGEHPEQADAAIDKVGDEVDERTGDKFSSQVDSGQEKAEDALGTDQN